MPFRKSKAAKAKVAVTEQVSDRTDDLVAALETAKEALARASAAAGRKGAELGKEASKAADKLMPERARQRRREAARKRNRRLLAGAAGLGGLLLLATRLGGSKGDPKQRLQRGADTSSGDWERPADPAAAEVTQLHQGNGATTNPARTPPS